MNVFLLLAAVAGSLGWEDANPERQPLPIARELHRAPIAANQVSVEWREGATGEVAVVESEGRQSLRIRKANSCGYALVKSRAVFTAPAGARLRAFADCRVTASAADGSYGLLTMWSGDEDLSYFVKFDRNGRGGPKQTGLYVSAPKTPDRKLCHYEMAAEGPVEIAIIVAGEPSVSYWSNWGVEDFTAAENQWKEFARKRPFATNMPERVILTDEQLDAQLAAEPDHTARIETIDGVSRFVLDGEPVQPILLKYSMSRDLRTFSGDIKLNAAGVKIFGTGVRLGYDPSSKRGFWTKDGFDVAGAAAVIRKAMCRAPNVKFLLTISVDPYPEFSSEHPDEIWVDHKGRRIIGDAGHAEYSQPKAVDDRHWYWVSYYSPSWRAAVKRRLSEFIAELKRQGLSKRIIGVHIAGFHDAQFSTAHPDHSAPAKATFAKWCKLNGRDLGSEEDFTVFQKQGPLIVQNALARHIKREFGKDIVIVRYCMTPFGGSYNATYDLTAFVNSEAIDILCAQPDYGRRVPGVPISHRVPLESFHRHGKYFLNELDLRTYGAHTPWEAELSCMTYSRAVDYPMWCATNRRLAGQMFAKRMGWWYLDMAGGWFDPDEIVADIKSTIETGRTLLAVKPSRWHSDVAIVVDEEGLLAKDLKERYYYPDEQLQNGSGIQTLSASGVPTDYWLMEDFLSDPAVAKQYKTIVFFGMYRIDDRRAKLVAALATDRRRLIFLPRTGAYGGSEKIGFSLSAKAAPACFELKATDPTGPRQYSLMAGNRFTRLLGVSPKDWRWRYYQPARGQIEPSSGVKAVACYADDGAMAIAERTLEDAKLVYVAPFGGLTPDYFHALAKESGAYLPTDVAGYQFDMNGDFMSIHSFANGPVDVRLPFVAKVRNLKTGDEEPEPTDTLRLNLTAGETVWFSLSRPD